MLILMVHFSGVFSKMNTTILFFYFFKIDTLDYPTVLGQVDMVSYFLSTSVLKSGDAQK